MERDRGTSELLMVTEYERRIARRRRGSCSQCGHQWTPRNPTTMVNRCPGCGIRGHVTYSQLSDKVTTPEDPPASAPAEAQTPDQATNAGDVDELPAEPPIQAATA